MKEVMIIRQIKHILKGIITPKEGCENVEELIKKHKNRKKKK